jgi:hypothetical protein
MTRLPPVVSGGSNLLKLYDEVTSGGGRDVLVYVLVYAGYFVAESLLCLEAESWLYLFLLQLWGLNNPGYTSSGRGFDSFSSSEEDDGLGRGGADEYYKTGLLELDVHDMCKLQPQK